MYIVPYISRSLLKRNTLFTLAANSSYLNTKSYPRTPNPRYRPVQPAFSPPTDQQPTPRYRRQAQHSPFRKAEGPIRQVFTVHDLS
jgi:hypothetical protein